jgi:transcriptional antiterminator RfaH
MDWYVIHTKPRQEARALVNLESQGYECYLPQLNKQKLHRGVLELAQEPLFPRYLFIRLDSTQSGKSWGPIRSTLGVSRLVTFGFEPARVDPNLMDLLKQHSEYVKADPTKLYQAGERLLISEGPFAGIEAIFEMDDGESRAMVLIELLSKPTHLKLPIASLSKTN